MPRRRGIIRSAAPRRVDVPRAQLRGLAFERLEERLALTADFGDAPAPYPTLLSDDGARHEAVGPLLGAVRDVEVDGIPSAAADGDGPDDDGIQFAPLHAGQRGATMTVTVAGAPAGALIDAWIDFNGDGVWSGPEEQIAASAPVVDGENTLTFDVPATISAGPKVARVRLSETGGLSPRGAAASGEVEDLVVQVNSPAPASGEFNRLVLAPSQNVYKYELASLVDVDGDGDFDIVGVDTFDTGLSWYENTGAGYAHHQIHSLSYDELVPVDFDKDGDVDIVTAPSSGFDWYENDGSQNFTRRLIDFAAGTQAAAPADVDGDGDLDVFAVMDVYISNQPTRTLAWYENDGNMQFTRRAIAGPGTYHLPSLHPVDIDADGDLDLVANGYSYPVVYQNDGQQGFSRHTLSPSSATIVDLTVADFDGDHDFDVLAATYSQDAQQIKTLEWYENAGALAFTRHVIAPTFFNLPEDVRSADIDGDGDIDGVISTRLRMAIVENDGHGNFTVRQPAETTGWSRAIQIIDYNADGDLDVVAAPGPDSSVVVFEQFDNRVSVTASAASVVEGGGQAVDFTFTRTGHPTTALQVNFAVAGSAAFAADYFQSGAAAFDAAAGVVEFQPGQATAVVRLTPVADVIRELDEAVQLTIQTSENYVVGSVASAATIVLDDDLADFGDAPAPYPVTLAANGARHAAGGPRLGADRDDELGGVPSAAATGDDQTGADDEDGIAFQTVRVGALSAVVHVDVQNAPAGARLDAWIDFDGDGTWNGVAERIAVGMPVLAGVNAISFDVPAAARSGETFARFRVSTAGGLGVVGPAVDGEVEDVAFTIDPPGGGNVFGAEVNIDAQFGNTRAAVPADFDGDGDMDFVAAITRQVFWYENNGAETFTAHLIGAFDRTPQAVQPVDLDADGDLDIAVVCGEFPSGRVAWLENAGAQGFTQHLIASFSDVVLALAVADLDADGDQDLVAVGRMNDGNVWYENAGAGVFTPHVFGSPITSQSIDAIDAGDIDGDGDVDLLADGLVSLEWHENAGGAFVTHTLPGTSSMYHSTRIADLDRDGDADLVTFAADGASIRWFENDGAEGFTQHAIANQAPVHDGSVVDLDGDGDLDLLVLPSSSGAAWYENDGQQNFTLRSISTTTSVAAVAAADVDGDGDLDILESNFQAPMLMWIKNVEQAVSIAASQTSGVEDAAAPVVLSFTRQGDASAPLTISFTVGGTAAFNTDYLQAGAATFTATQGTIAFAAGQTLAQVTLTPKPDSLLEINESIVITLRRGPDAGILAPEQVTFTILDDEPVDFGDAPARYKTLRNDGGAGHAATGPTLGPSRDADSEGAPSAAADGDNLVGPDEDGVTFGGLRVGQVRASATVHVAGAPSGARLDAWIDFDGDGTWAAGGEQIANSLLLSNGETTIYFDVPPAARSGGAYARFRLSTAGGLAPTGLAADGEVEDYRVDVAPPAPASHAFVTAATFASTLRPEPADLDRDGDVDFFAHRTLQGGVAPYINVGDQFTAQGVLNANGVTSHVPVDFDRDGDVDLVVARDNFSNALQWLEKTTSSSVVRTISTATQRISRPVVVDVDRDGDLDVVAGSTVEDVSWYENRGTQPFLRRSIASTGGDVSVDAVDFDGDGDVDVLSAGSHGIVWHENNGAQLFTTHPLVVPPTAAREVHVADFDGDGDMDVVANLTVAGVVAWLENVAGAFTVHVVNLPAASYPTLEPVDFDGDGDVDVLAASSAGVLLFENTATGFSPRTLAPGSAASARAADVDQDGDLDVLAEFVGSYSVWLENIARADGDGDDDGDVDGGDMLAWQRSLGTTVPRGTGADGNGDGKITAADLAVWKATYGTQDPAPMALGMAVARDDGTASTATSSSALPEDAGGDADPQPAELVALAQTAVHDATRAKGAAVRLRGLLRPTLPAYPSGADAVFGASSGVEAFASGCWLCEGNSSARGASESADKRALDEAFETLASRRLSKLTLASTAVRVSRD